MYNQGEYTRALIQLEEFDANPHELAKKLSLQRWGSTTKSAELQFLEKGLLPLEDYKQLMEQQQTVDVDKDADVIFADFLRFYQIDLFEENIDYFKFITLLNSLFENEDSGMHKRIQYRSHKDKSEKGYEDYNKFMNNKKDLYALYDPPKGGDNIWQKIQK